MKKHLLMLAAAAAFLACSGHHDPENNDVVDTPTEEPTDDTTTVAPEETVDSAYQRNVCVMEFTGQHCSFCPKGYTYMAYVVEKYYSDIAYIIAIHNTGSGSDDFAFDATEQVFADSGAGSNPYSYIDMRTLAPITSDTEGAFSAAIKSSLNDYPAHCGLSMASTYSDGQVSVKINLTSELTDKYYLAAWVVEDGITAYQLNGSAEQSDYKHHHVARALVSESYKGDSLGTIEAGEEVSKTYSFTVSSEWELENTTILALAIDSDGYVNNCLDCEILNGETEYQLLTTEN